MKTPLEDKFKKINLTNEAFQKRVGKITGGLTILKGAGFEQTDDGTLEIHEIKEPIIKEALRLLENNL